MAFHEARFPHNVSRGARGGPERRTQIVELASGDEERNASCANSRRRYDVAYGIRRADDLAAVVAFFEARNGRLHGFRFKDWGDYKSCLPSGTPSPSDQAIGIGDGATTGFQLEKRYVSGSQTWVRAIAKPVVDTVRIALDGVEQPSGWSVDTATGVVTFDTAPVSGVAISAGFEFDVPVRFDTDALDVTLDLERLTTIRSGASTYPAVQACRDLLADVRSILGSATKIGYAADWSEYFGHQPGNGSGDVFFHLDPLWADLEIDFVGIDNYMPLSDWRDGFEHADAAEGWPAIYDRAYLQANIAGGEGFDWFYASDADRSAQVRTPITDGAAVKPWVFRYKDLRAWWSNPHYNRPSGVESGTPTAWVPQSKPIWFTELGCPAIDRGTNQPNVFFDPKSSESFTPHFSRGWRDDAIQRAYLEATYLWWGDTGNNSVSGVYGGRMVHVPKCAAWTWDARPYPFFPALSDVWTDGSNWRLGHWLTGRLGAMSLAALVRHLCLRAGMPEARIDVTGLWGAIEGYAIGALESPRASITTLSRHFGFDAVETEGMIRFVMRGRASVARLGADDLVAAREGELLELTRGQETELPQALKWQVARADEDYDAALVEARRITVDTTRIASESFPMAVPPEEADRRCRRALMEAWVGRETAAFRLPPSRLALDPADAIRLEHDGRPADLRLVSIADAEARGIESVRQDRATYDLPPGDPRAASLTRAVVFGAPDAVLMDLPQLTEDQPAHRPLVAAETPPAREVLADSRTMKGGGAAGVATLGAAGVEVAQSVLAETQTAILPLVPYLDTLRWVFIVVALGGIAVTIYARLDDWKKGLR